MVNNTHLLHLIRMLLEQSKWTHLNWSLIFFRRAPVFNNFRASWAISSALLRCSMIGLTPRVPASFKMPRSRFRSVGTAQRAGFGIPRYPSTSGSTKGSSHRLSDGSKKLHLPGRYPPSSSQVVCDILPPYSRKWSFFPQQQTASKKGRTHCQHFTPTRYQCQITCCLPVH